MKLLCTTVLTVSRVKVQSFSLCEYMTDGAEGRDTVVSGSLKQQPGQGYAPEAIPYGDGAQFMKRSQNVARRPSASTPCS
jgi:hypothetical protein